MAFIIEDGIGRRGANSYASVPFMREFSTERGRTEFEGLTDAQVQVLGIRGTDYIETRWSRQFRGTKKFGFQGLSWPREDAYDDEGDLINGIPLVVCRATVLMAQRAKGTDRLLPDPPPPFSTTDDEGNTTDSSTGEIHSETKQVGEIRTTTTYAHTGLQSSSIIKHTTIAGVSNQEYPEVAHMIRSVLIGTAGGFGNMVIKN